MEQVQERCLPNGLDTRNKMNEINIAIGSSTIDEILAEWKEEHPNAAIKMFGTDSVTVRIMYTE